jgi:hypothetical protein
LDGRERSGGAELPHLERLYERVAGRPDIAILTFNADMKAGLVGPCLKESGWRFPVLLAYRFLVNLSGPPSVPRNWIVDRDGVVRYVAMGFDAEGDSGTMMPRESREESIPSMNQAAGGGLGADWRPRPPAAGYTERYASPGNRES